MAARQSGQLWAHLMLAQAATRIEIIILVWLQLTGTWSQRSSCESDLSPHLTWLPSVILFGTTFRLIHMLLEADIALSVTLA